MSDGLQAGAGAAGPLALLPLVRPVYPERRDRPPGGRLERVGDQVLGRLSRAWRTRGALDRGFVARVRSLEPEYRALDATGVRQAAAAQGRVLRRQGLTDATVAGAFALVASTAARTLGKQPYDVQLLGGRVLLRGMVAEMDTGEGKTLTATLPAATAALAGIGVHVITVNDYLAKRDAELTRPLYEALGLSVGVVLEDQSAEARRAAYGCQVVYGTNKTIVFDYLRDRIALAGRPGSLRMRLQRLGGRDAGAGRLLLRGLAFAIVDEADGVLVDEARTPLIISAPSGSGDEERVAREAVELGRCMQAGRDFMVETAERRIRLTKAGRQQLDAFAVERGGLWAGRLRREELAVQALGALHLYRRDEHYLVRDGRVEIVDEYTGRTMADRSWERGLHQMVEAKEGCEISARKEPLSRISYQRFFRRYLLLSGMTGTAREVAGELGSVYGLPVVRIPTHRPGQRVVRPTRVFASAGAKWAAIVDRVRSLHEADVPVLVGTRSVAASEHASRLLEAAGLAHQVLNAKQDGEEAAIVARAGERGRITLATNMAGRGTDIALGEGVAALGGLHVILTERHDTGRVDRQLAGRCARQGDPGCFEALVSLEDPLTEALPGPLRWLAALALRLPAPLGQWLAEGFVRHAQRRAERSHSRARRAMLRADQHSGSTLAFSGTQE